MAAGPFAAINLRLLAGAVLVYLLLYPWAALAHELGHAAVALAVTDGPVTVRLGQRSTLEWSVGRLTVGLDHRAPLQRWQGTCVYDTLSDRRVARAAVNAAGPVVTAVVVAGASVGAAIAGGVVAVALGWLFWLTGLQLVLTLVPMTYPTGQPGPGNRVSSDGKQVLDALLGRGGDGGGPDPEMERHGG